MTRSARPPKSDIPRATRMYDKQQREAAEAVLREPEKHGAGLVEWAKLVLEDSKES